ncbi:MAG: hypothetical protein M3Q36_01555 [bacterium]|nr:hypothetical protein [bacterium]
MNRRINSETDDMNSIMASVINDEQIKIKKSKLRKLLKRNKSSGNLERPRKRNWESLNNDSPGSYNAYSHAVFGPTRTNRAPQRSNNYHTIAIQLPSLRMLPFRRWFSRNRSLLTGLMVTVIVIGIVITGSKFYLNSRNNSDSSNNQAGILAPEKVFVPVGLPEGFEIGSKKETLENGALIFSVFDPEGRLIAITQQAKPTEFDMALFKNVPKFNSPHGEAYILEEPGRINGYIFGEETWVLFNGSGGVKYQDLKKLMLTLQPGES